jgi:translation initiation factor IF-2
MGKKNWARKASAKSSAPPPPSSDEEPGEDSVIPTQRNEELTNLSGMSSYILTLVQEMRENEKRMNDILDQSLLMISKIDWKEVRKHARTTANSEDTFRSMVQNMLDVFTGIVMNCSTFGTACNLALDLLMFDIERKEDVITEEQLADIDAAEVDPTSLDWILKAASSPVERDPQHEMMVGFREDLEGYANSFADISTKAVIAMKSAVVRCTGF